LAHAPVLPGLNTLIKLKKYWIVSVAALNYRLHQLGALSDWHYNKLCVEIAQRGYRTKEPDESQREMSLLFPQLFKSLRDDGYTKADIANELLYPVEEIDKLVFGLILVALEGGTGNTKSKRKRPDLHLVG